MALAHDSCGPIITEYGPSPSGDMHKNPFGALGKAGLLESLPPDTCLDAPDASAASVRGLPQELSADTTQLAMKASSSGHERSLKTRAHGFGHWGQTRMLLVTSLSILAVNLLIRASGDGYRFQSDAQLLGCFMLQALDGLL